MSEDAMPFDGRSEIRRDGFSYLPQFISKDESSDLIHYFSSLTPLWEERYRDGGPSGSKRNARRLTRPVYWLGAWQFACLGYYSEPDHIEHRCVRAEPFPSVMNSILERLGPLLNDRHPVTDTRLSEVPNTCLINYYGRKTDRQVPVDVARLRMHRDHEPGPVIMFCLGQPGLLEFIDPDKPKHAQIHLSMWTRHRSVCILSGPTFKDRLYHQIKKVRTGAIPAMQSPLDDFELRRVSVSFRHVPPSVISHFAELPANKQAMIQDYMQTLGQSSPFFKRQSSSID